MSAISQASDSAVGGPAPTRLAERSNPHHRARVLVRLRVGVIAARLAPNHGSSHPRRMAIRQGGRKDLARGQRWDQMAYLRMSAASVILGGALADASAHTRLAERANPALGVFAARVAPNDASSHPRRMAIRQGGLPEVLARRPCRRAFFSVPCVSDGGGRRVWRIAAMTCRRGWRRRRYRSAGAAIGQRCRWRCREHRCRCRWRCRDRLQPLGVRCGLFGVLSVLGCSLCRTLCALCRTLCARCRLVTPRLR